MQQVRTATKQQKCLVCNKPIEKGSAIDIVIRPQGESTFMSEIIGYKHPECNDNLCVVCGLPVHWGIDGCPMVGKGKEMLALLGGGWKYMKHYGCELKKENQ